MRPGSEDEALFAQALDALLLQQALEIVSDGEGATRVARLTVSGPVGTAEPVARAVATSALVQAALAGADPNWGRILQAAGGVLREPPAAGFDLAIGASSWPTAATPSSCDELQLQARRAAMAAAEVEIDISMGPGDDRAEVYFCDIGHDYITLNAEYTT